MVSEQESRAMYPLQRAYTQQCLKQGVLLVDCARHPKRRGISINDGSANDADQPGVLEATSTCAFLTYDGFFNEFANSPQAALHRFTVQDLR